MAHLTNVRRTALHTVENRLCILPGNGAREKLEGESHDYVLANRLKRRLDDGINIFLGLGSPMRSGFDALTPPPTFPSLSRNKWPSVTEALCSTTVDVILAMNHCKLIFFLCVEPGLKSEKRKKEILSRHRTWSFKFI